MSTYTPQPGVFVGRPPCAACGANLQLHTLPEEEALALQMPQRSDGQYLTSGELQRLLERRVPLRCPAAYRPTRIEEAQRALAQAEASGDPVRVFAARGDLQRLTGRRSESTV